LASPTASWKFFAVDASDGQVLKTLTFPGSAINGPVVDDGRIYVGTGNSVLNVPPLISFDFSGGVYSLGLRDD
jgi:outer membrane protein assembly factor BamB